MLRLGLCCQFAQAPIHFRTTTAAFLTRLRERGGDPNAHLEGIIADNAYALGQAIDYCAKHGIGSFRVTSRFCPLITHPTFSYPFDSLPNPIHTALRECRQKGWEKDVRLTFHPDQFVVINSPRIEVVAKSAAELEYHGALAEAIGADVITIHAGGGYGDKKGALDRFVANARQLSSRVIKRLTLENDDKIYTPSDLLPSCKKLNIPLVYDIHHHRCNSDPLSVEAASKKAFSTWDREPLFHLSSPLGGWGGFNPKRHSDFIDFGDFPKCWKGLELTVDIEAKAKEKAVLKLRKQLSQKGWQLKERRKSP